MTGWDLLGWVGVLTAACGFGALATSPTAGLIGLVAGVCIASAGFGHDQ